MAAAAQPQVIVVGGGLAGLSAAHTVLQAGHRVLLLDKSAFMGGNSTKATSGINGSETQAQRDAGIPDSNKVFEEDTIRSATGVKTGPCPPPYPLGKVLTHNSGPAVEWIGNSFGLKLDAVSRLGGHSYPRTHRAKTGSRFPGMMITYALMEKLEEIAEKEPHRARIITKARANKLITSPNGEVIGCEYIHNGKTFREDGPVVIASGGYAAGGLFADSLLQKVRPDLMNLPTTNGVHCTGDGVEMALNIGAGAVDLKHVQVHPTGLVHPDDPDNRVKFLAAECLRGEGGILLDKNGKRFCNELGTRDYVTGMMWENEGPFRLILNGKAARDIEWHIKHYTGRGVMAPFENGHKLAQHMGISPDTLADTFAAYNSYAKNGGGDPWNTSFFDGAPFSMDEPLHVAIVTPVVHYTMGGVKIDDKARVQKSGQDVPVPGLFAAGEATGGVHGRNRLGGSALLECVVFGRVAGSSAVEHLRTKQASSAVPDAGGAGSILITVPQANGKDITIQINGGGQGGSAAASAPAAASSAAAPAGLGESTTDAPISTPAPPAHADGQNVGDRMTDDAGTSSSSSSSSGGKKEMKEYTLEEVAKHNTEDDCWVVINGEVLDVTDFMDDHPGGKMAIMTFAGKDASEEYNMVHEPNTIEKYAQECVIGTLKPSSRL